MNLTVLPLFPQKSTLPNAFCQVNETYLLVGARSPNLYTQRGVDVHTTHNDKASADALDIDSKVLIVGEGTGQVPVIIVVMIHGVYGVHIWYPVPPQKLQLALTERKLMIWARQTSTWTPPFTHLQPTYSDLHHGHSPSPRSNCTWNT